ncbi:MAG: hypothetical protein J6O56_02765 [Bacilli bacterium]|nr:hypothetical protein [Bacilli bacterium]
MAIDDVDKEENVIKIEKIIEDSGYDITYLNSNFNLYERIYSNSQVQSFRKNYNAYREYRSKKLKEIREDLKKEKQKVELKKNIDHARDVIKLYIDSIGMSYISFLNNNNITEEEFNNFVESVKLYDKKLYKLYKDTKTKKEIEFSDGLDDELEELGLRLINGYEENGKKRKFDIIDYYNITSIPLSNIVNIASKKLNRTQLYELKKIKNGFMHSDKYNSSEEKAILEEKRIVGVQFDKNGKIIEGSGREISLDEKKNILEFLKKNNISINRMTYNAALKRYIGGFITFDTKELVLKPIKNS